MQLFLITIFVLVIHQYHCHSNTGSVSLRDKWKNQIKIGLNDGKRIVSILNSERKSAILNQIHLLTNFIGAVDSLAVFIMDFNPKTEQKYFKDIKSIFTEINKKLELTTDAKFGRDFREIFFELRSMDFSFMLLNKYLEKMDALKCTSSSECKEKIQWTAEIFRNDFDIADDYSHILRATLNGTRFSDISVVRQVKTSSRCDEQIMLNFGVNLLLKFFKAKQVIIVYQKLSQPNVSSIANIQEWANDMYVFRKHLFQAMQECFSKNVCKAYCGKGNCILLPKTKQDNCICPEYNDGHRCQIHNQVNSAIDIVAVISLLKRVPKLDPIIDRRMITNYLSTSLKCVPDAFEIVQNFNIHKIKENILTIADLGPFYNTYLALKFYIKQAMDGLKSQSFKGANHKRIVLSRIAVNLHRVLYKIDAYFNYRQIDDTFKPESLLTAVINRNQAEACTDNYKTKINTLWRKFHITQSHGFSVLLMVNHVLGKSTVPVVRLYEERLKNQIQFVNDSSCGAIIAHSSNVKCEQFHLESGQCSCKDNFTGLHCEIKVHQDCKWSDWTGWSSCSRTCGTGGEHKRLRRVAVKQQGSGKKCSGSSKESRQCFKKCCDGTYHCRDISKCSSQCQPCNCHDEGSTSGTCLRNGECSCKLYYDGRRCQDFKPVDCSVLNKTTYGDGVYMVYPRGGTGFEVYCDMKTDGGGWTVFQRRVDGAVGFNRRWSEYENGFGDVKHEFWLGNAKLHRLTTMGTTELRIDLVNYKWKRGYAKYSSFLVTNARDQYRLRVSGYSGNAGDSLAYHNGLRFSTADRDYDTHHINCGEKYQAGWWYNGCFYSNLTGNFNRRGEYGVTWYHMDNNYGTILRSKMMLRRT
ncbi:Hypothetical predicted protein [Mytilus galloprovincialis]|uniref:Fibrinogen C-terminal domain-containing protein n=1 Tax=Mytilus galloprovincialis TaxID=29158 RepID=A0A8B6CAB7_MYTGA|nr:Hypothetical predicted protein [Mytilus galloprovincialis]